MLTSIYRKLVKVLRGKPRILIEEFLKNFECSPGLYIVKLPTGYGKTSIVYVQALSTLMGECSSATIYVAPLRSLVDDVYCRWRSIASRVLGEDLVRELSGVQHMGIAESVYLNKPVVYTTMDTFLLHLFKLPPPELKHYAKAMIFQQVYRGHYEVSRGLIANSTILLDEPHLTIHSTAMVKALLSAIRFLAYIRSTVILMTATLPRKLEELILRAVEGYLGNDKIRKCSYGEEGYVDKGFEEEQMNKDIRTELMLGKTLEAEDIIKAVDEYDRVLVVVNRRTKAINLYSRAKELLSRKGLDKELFLLHGFMLEGERRRIVERIRELSRKHKRFILITTQVIEAGFDLSSDILLTELAPPPSIIQRVGRVARWDEDEGVVRIYNVQDPKPYTSEDLQLVREILEHSKCILWRTPRPYGYGECMDYIEFLEKATIVKEKDILSDVYNIADYVADASSTLTLLYKVFSGELLREKPLLVPLYVKDRLDEGGIPVDLDMLINLLREDRIIGYIMGSEVVTDIGNVNKLKDVILDLSDPVKIWVTLESNNIKGLVISNRVYERLAYGS